MNKQLPTTYIVVTLLALSVHGELIKAETPLEVDRATRNDWVGSRLARDATSDEIAAYRAEQGEDGLDDLEAQRATLEVAIADLERRRDALRVELEQLEAVKAAADPAATDAKDGKK